MAEEAILRLLRERGSRGALQSEIVESTGYSKSTISYFLSKLESKGHLTRRRDGASGFRVWLKGLEGQGKLVRVGVVRAAEYPFIFDFKFKLEEKGVGVYVKAYNDGVSIMRDLVKGKLDLGLCPLITQLIFHDCYRGVFRTLMSGASGGGSVVLRGDAKLEDVKRAGSSLASTMDACLSTYLRELGLSDVEIVYFSSPQQMIKALEEGHVQLLGIWEPYASMLEAKGHKRLSRFADYLGLYPCCVAAVRLMDEELLELLTRSFTDSLSKRDYEEDVFKLSNLVGVDPAVLRKSLLEYTFHPHFEFKDVKRYLKAVGFEGATSWILGEVGSS